MLYEGLLDKLIALESNRNQEKEFELRLFPSGVTLLRYYPYYPTESQLIEVPTMTTVGVLTLLFLED